MNPTKQQIMAELALTIQKKWGTQAVRQGFEGATVVSIAPLSTAYPKLDSLLRGGILPGQVTELWGIHTSGTTTLALKTIAAAQAQGEKVIYIDHSLALYTKYAADFEVNLADLLIVHPSNQTEGIEIAADLALRYNAGLLVYGYATGAKSSVNPAALRRLVNAVRRSSCAFITLNRAAVPAACQFHPYAATRLQFLRRRWIRHWGVIRGYLIQVRVLKLNGSDCNRSVTLRIDLP